MLEVGIVIAVYAATAYALLIIVDEMEQGADDEGDEDDGSEVHYKR